MINEKEKAKAKAYAEKHPEKKTFMQKMLEQQAELDKQQSNVGKKSRSEQNKANRDKINEARKRMAEKYGDQYDEDNDEE